jgi:broad specificity phosphatase PhoE
MELFIIRHGQSSNNALTDDSQRTFDPILTDLGKQQAERLAQFLADRRNRDVEFNTGSGFASDAGEHGFGITHLYCSAMHRAMQTAAPVSKALGLPVEIWPDIHEQGGMYLERDGSAIGYPGKTRAEILTEFPDYVLPASITDAGWYDAARGYEETYTGAGRAIKVVMELRRRAAGEFSGARIALITHGTFIDLMLKALLGQLPNRSYFFTHYNTAITRVDFSGEYLLMRYINRVDHLPHEMIS